MKTKTKDPVFVSRGLTDEQAAIREANVAEARLYVARIRDSLKRKIADHVLSVYLYGERHLQYDEPRLRRMYVTVAERLRSILRLQ